MPLKAFCRMTTLDAVVGRFVQVPVGARNSVVPVHAAFLYSLMSPWHRVDLTIRSWVGSRSTVTGGSLLSGGR